MRGEDTGRFLSADSVVPDPADGQSYNRYTYVNNRPLSLTDPTGHAGCNSTDGTISYACLQTLNQEAIDRIRAAMAAAMYLGYNPGRGLINAMSAAYSSSAINSAAGSGWGSTTITFANAGALSAGMDVLSNFGMYGLPVYMSANAIGSNGAAPPPTIIGAGGVPFRFLIH